MPFGDGTGPVWQNQGQGTGRGRGRGLGMGRGRGVGPIGNCVCAQCGYKAPKQPGIPCQSTRCPKCQGVMVRDWGANSSGSNLPPANPSSSNENTN